MSELSNLISRLKRGISKNASYINTIRNPQLLVASLQELHDLIGNNKVKDAVATQVTHLIMVRRRASKKSGIKEDEVMLNTVLYGPPGVGKTLIGTKLAKIWYSLGYLDGSRNIKEKKQELGDLLKDLLKDTSNTTGSDNSTLALYIMMIFIIIFITIISLTWTMYNKLGGQLTAIIVAFLIVIIVCFGYYLFNSMNSQNSENKGTESKNKNSENVSMNDRNKYIKDMPSDDQIIKVVTRADFVDRYVGWTSPKTIKLLEENLGKVLFVDEAYSLINGPHDEFGMEALTSLNLFLSQRSKEIIVIFAGYKDLLETGPYAVQPGLKRRFMWQFECNGYTSEELYEIFKIQLAKKGWGLSDEEITKELFRKNKDAFPSFGGDTERAGFFSELEHSRDFINNEDGMKINMLEPKHIERGIFKLRENNFDESTEESSNPLANMMKLISGKNKEDKKKPKRANNISLEDSIDSELLDAIKNRSGELFKK